MSDLRRSVLSLYKTVSQTKALSQSRQSIKVFVCQSKSRCFTMDEIGRRHKVTITFWTDVENPFARMLTKLTRNVSGNALDEENL